MAEGSMALRKSSLVSTSQRIAFTLFISNKIPPFRMCVALMNLCLDCMSYRAGLAFSTVAVSLIVFICREDFSNLKSMSMCLSLTACETCCLGLRPLWII
jgi:hypothetical protein